MIYHHKGYPKCIVKALEDMAGQQKKLTGWRQTAQDAEEIVEGYPNARVYAWPEHHNVLWVMLEVDTMEQITDLLRKFGARGYNQVKEVSEDPSDNKREYHLKNICLQVQLSGVVCRYVKVGEKTKVEDVYELKCDKQEAEAA